MICLKDGRKESNECRHISKYIFLTSISGMTGMILRVMKSIMSTIDYSKIETYGQGLGSQYRVTVKR